MILCIFLHNSYCAGWRKSILTYFVTVLFILYEYNARDYALIHYFCFHYYSMDIFILLIWKIIGFNVSADIMGLFKTSYKKTKSPYTIVCFLTSKISYKFELWYGCFVNGKPLPSKEDNYPSLRL